jgi:NhaP-type Na+/H+ or K+/H+ antiporter
VSVGILSVLVAAVLAPPFTGSSPWILGGIAAVLLPLGPIVCRPLIGRARSPARVPALRRLDSVVLLAPAWPAAIALLLTKH